MIARFSKDVAVYGGTDFALKLIQFAAIPLIAQALSLVEFGAYALLQVVVLLGGVLVNLGTSWAVQRFYFDADYKGRARATLVTTGLAQIIAMGLFFLAVSAGLVASGIIAVPGVGGSVVIPILALLIVLPEQLSQYCMDLSRLKFRAWSFVALAVIKNLLGFLVGLYLLIVADLGLAGLLIGSLAGAWLAVPLGVWLIRDDLAPRVSREHQQALIRFGGPFVLTATAFWLFTSSDRWLLARFATVADVGLFSIAFKFASVMSMVIAAFHQAWIPTAMRMALEDPAHRAKFARVAVAWLFLLSFVALGLALFASDILRVMTPRPYWDAGPSLIMAAVALGLSGTIQVTSLGVTLEKRTGLVATGTWIAAALNIGLNLLLIPGMGALGSAFSLVLTYAYLTCFYWYWSQRLHRIPVNYAHLSFGLAVLLSCLLALALPEAEAFAVRPTLFKALVLGLVLAAAARLRLFASLARPELALVRGAGPDRLPVE